MEHNSDGDSNCNCCTWYSHQKIDTWARRLGNKRTSGEYPNYCTIKIGQNTGAGPGDERRLTVTQTLVTNHRLTLV